MVILFRLTPSSNLKPQAFQDKTCGQPLKFHQNLPKNQQKIKKLTILALLFTGDKNSSSSLLIHSASKLFFCVLKVLIYCWC